ncbi:hypothetical protein GH810_09625 [Acetobacterium paludosum]|uniref:Tetratricopeptide repeat protein n=1 Tax=Acetobacterium paludosum TaxID=52693 RepID=A0A923HYY3_9FIRM|nr:hypothetical protein [Acetobacterium paludosum]MBC3888566.1 hypothetical protein [Acetobacterium paludosum]
MMKLLFCNGAWMKYYQGITEDDMPQEGGTLIDESRSVGEAYNFMDYNRKCYGHVISFDNLDLEKCDPEISRQDPQSEGFIIVWCATADDGKMRIVGWYENATAYREAQFVPSFTDENASLYFNFVAAARDCHLLPEDQRTFEIKKASVAGTGSGVSQSNVWYGESDDAKNELIPEVLRYMKEYNGEFANLTVTDEMIHAVIDKASLKAGYDELFEKGMAYCNEEDYQKALKCFNTARTMKETPELLYNIAYILFLYYCFDDAIPLFEKCLKSGFEPEGVLPLLVSCYDFIGNREKTLESCKMLMKILKNPLNENYMDYRIFYCTIMCDIYVYLGDFKNAADIAKQILTYADDEETQEHVRELLLFIKEAQED